MEDLLIRTISEKDIEEICKIEDNSFANPWTKGMFAGELENRFSFGYCMLDAEKIVGYIIFWIIFDELHIANIAVEKNNRNMGIATRLIELALEKGIADNGVKAAMLEVRCSNLAAINLYKNFNFSIDFIRKSYYSEPKEDASVMVLDVKKYAELISLESSAVL